MRLIIFTHSDLASNFNLNLLLPHVHQHVVQIFISDTPDSPKTDLPKSLKTLKFFEQDMPNNILFPEIDGDTSKILTNDKLLTFNGLAAKYNVKIDTLNDVRSAESLDKIAALKPDLMLSVRYRKIFGDACIKIPKRGIINLHSGKLPHYRGVLATFRALSNGDDTIHGTLHYIQNATIDTGDIIGMSHVKVDKNRSLLSHILSIYAASLPLLVQTIEKISNNEKPHTSHQNAENGQYFTFPTQAEIDDFTAKGWYFINMEEYEQFMSQYM